MDKKKIAVLFGGCSSEYGISLKSSYGILSHIDREKYEPVPIGITEKGDWFRYYGDVENIIDDSWQADKASLVKNTRSSDRSVHGMMELTEEGAVFTRLDGVFPVLHGKNGEDGTVQGPDQAGRHPADGLRRHVLGPVHGQIPRSRDRRGSWHRRA